MLEVKIPGIRRGDQYKAGEDLLQGTIGYISGMDSNGYYLIKCPTSCTAAAVAIYPFKKYRFEEDLGDTSLAVETIYSGDRLVVFEGGEYITDRFIHTGLSTVGATRTSEYYWDTVAGYTDTAAYTLGAGKPIWLYVSTAAATKGYLKATSAGCTSALKSGVFYIKNRNFVLTRVWGGPYYASNRLSFKVIAQNGYGGMCLASSGPSGSSAYPIWFGTV